MPCCVARGVTEDDLQGKNAQFAGPADLADLMMEADRAINF
jgi:sulfur relay (sulfurtransferase) complex TusBCD TusD component (DsrE family)